MTGPVPARLWGWRFLAWGAAGLALVVLLLGAFPWGLVARHAAGPLSSALGRPVTVGSARRLDIFSFVPTIQLRDVRVAQPAWAGAGSLASARSLSVRLPILPLLVGQVRPRSIEADGLALHLVRDRSGRENWSDGGRGSGGRKRRPDLADLIIRGGRLRLDDARHGLIVDAALASDRTRGLRVAGGGTLRGSPLKLSLAGPPILPARSSDPYPVRVSVTSALASIDADVRMDRPLDTGHFTATIRAAGRDLGYLDDIIQAGLFRTQPFRLTADVRHDGADWRIPRLDATVGRSGFTAALDITKPRGRTHLAGRLDARTLDFDDFASDEQKARGAAMKARTGPRIVPDTRIVLDKVKLDGTLRVHAARLLAPGPSPFRSLDATVTLADRKLTLFPLLVGLPQGRMTGRASVDSRGRTPGLALDLRIAGATIDSFFPRQQVVAGPLRARVMLAGTGATVRDALAQGDGRVALVVDRGSIRRDYATFLGGDVLKSVGAAVDGKQSRTSLGCLVANFTVNRGRMTPHPLLLSTPVARGDGTGAVILGPETVDLRIAGRPTTPGPLLSTAPVRLFGTLSQPRIDIRPPRARDQKQNDLLSRVGFFIKKLRVRGDRDAQAAPPVSCAAEIRRALR